MQQKMNNKNKHFPSQFGLSSEDSNTSSWSLISSDENNIESTDRFIHLKETKTHLFCLIPSDNETSKNLSRVPKLIRIKISKSRPQSRHLRKNKVLDCSNWPGGISNVELMVSSNRTRTKNDFKMSSSNLLGNRKKTDHPSFVVLSDSKKHADFNVKIRENKSTSDNSNETYVIRSKDENKLLASRTSQTSFRHDMVCPNLIESSEGNVGQGPNETKSEEYCECAKNVRRPINSLQLTSKNDIVSTKDPSNNQEINRNPEKLFRIKFIEPTSLDISSRLKSGQDREEKKYKTPRYMCPKITRIFPPDDNTSRDGSEFNYSRKTSSNNELVKIKYSLVQRCLKDSSADEKCEVLNALRMRIKSKVSTVAANTIEDIRKFDLFGIQCEYNSRTILEDLLWPINCRNPHPLQISIARLINAMVSYDTGRDYFHNRSIIHLLMWDDLGRDNIDEEMADNLIAVMMKLSKNRFQCTDMIKQGLLGWLLKHMELAEYSSSKYHLECMSRLLYMLMRLENSIDFSMMEIRDWIVMLGRYLDSKHINVRKNTLAALLALFQRNGVIACANQINFAHIIDKHIEMSSTPNEKKHFKILNELLTGKSNLTKTQKSSIRSAEQELYLDEDIEIFDDSEIDYFAGEKLLREKFNVHKDEQSSSRNRTKTTTQSYNQQDDNLASRVFIEHLHCLLPKIDKNRIFPMFNHRSVDSSQTCGHINVTPPPPPRPPYLSGTARTSKFYDRALRKENQLTNTIGQHIQRNSVAKKLSKQMSSRTATEQKTHLQRDLKRHHKQSLAATETTNEKIVEIQQFSVGETNMLKDEVVAGQKNYQLLSSGAIETLKDESPKYQESLTNIMDMLIDRQLSVRTSDITQDELTAEPANDLGLTSGGPEAFIYEIVHGPKNDQQFIAGMTEQFKKEAVTVKAESVKDPQILNDKLHKSEKELSVGESEEWKVDSTIDDESEKNTFVTEIEERSSLETTNQLKDESLERGNRELSFEEPKSSEDHVTGRLKSTEEVETLKGNKFSSGDRQLSVGGANVTLSEKLAVGSEFVKYKEISDVEPYMLQDESVAGLKNDEDSSAGTMAELKHELVEYEAVSIFAGSSGKLSENLRTETLTRSKTDQILFVEDATRAISKDRISAKSLESLNEEVIVRWTSDEGVDVSDKLKEDIASTRSDQQEGSTSLNTLGAADVRRTSEHEQLVEIDAMKESKEESELSVKSDQQIYNEDIRQTITQKELMSPGNPEEHKEEIIYRNLGDRHEGATRLSKELQCDEKSTSDAKKSLKRAHTPAMIKSSETIPQTKTQQLEIYARELNEGVIAPLEIYHKFEEQAAASKEDDEHINAPKEVSQSQHLFTDSKEIKEQTDATLHIPRLTPRSVEVGQMHEIKKGASDHYLASSATADQEPVSSVGSAPQLTPRSVEILNEVTISQSVSEHPVSSGGVKCNRRLAARSMNSLKVNEMEKSTSDQHVPAGVKSSQSLMEKSGHTVKEEKWNTQPSGRHSSAMDVVGLTNAHECGTDTIQTKEKEVTAHLEILTADVKDSDEVVSSRIGQEPIEEVNKYTSYQHSARKEHVATMKSDEQLLPSDADISSNKSTTRSTNHHIPALSRSHEWIKIIKNFHPRREVMQL